MPETSSQRDFVASLCNPLAPVPPGVTTVRGEPDPVRFAVYRNNVMVSLIAALESKFPVARRIVGEEFFREMVRAYIRSAKPQSPLIFRYGDDLPEFIAGFEPARSVPYLADIARLEVFWTRAYHAADGVPMDMPAMARVPAETLAGSTIVPHPSAALLRSPWPAGSIWEANQHDQVGALGRSGPETVLVVRPQAEVGVHILPTQDRQFATDLFAGASLGDAAERATSESDFDFGRALLGLTSLGAIQALRPLRKGNS